ncbi:MAG: SDR family NAD(P)-dependent oxidoreductase [Nitrospiraceae bacterium]|nr:SDR family NAD(P)-dependent oxidoreductase [Nitrospiraceae bacterium]
MYEVSGIAGRVTLVTSGASGMGEGVAQVFAQAGGNVMIGDLNLDTVRCTADRLKGQGGSASAVELDVTSRASIGAAVTLIEGQHGTVDALVNNAGISSVRPFQEITEDDWDRLMLVNLKGVLLVTQTVLSPLVEREQGRIISISSMAGKEGPANLAHCCGSEFGAIGLTQSPDREVAAENITVNAICPGVVRTPLWDDAQRGTLKELDSENGCKRFVDGVPLGRRQSAIDMAYTCLFLAFDLAENITGQAMNVSGG